MKRLLLIAPFVLLACSGESVTGPDGPVAFTDVHKNHTSGILTRREEVISRADRWQQVWAEITGNVSPRPPAPSVDFESSLLLFVALGSTPDSCRSIAIDGVERRGGALRIQVKESRQPQNCACPAIVVQPVHVVRVPRAATDAVFLRREVTNPTCN